MPFIRPLQKKLALRAFFACIVRIDALEYPTGEMAEWSNAFDLKSNVVKATEGSNPSLSVNKTKKLPYGSFFVLFTERGFA